MKTLADDIAQNIYEMYGGQAVPMSAIYAANEALKTNTDSRKIHRAIIRATLQSGHLYSPQYHWGANKNYFDHVAYGVWRVNKHTAKRLRRTL